MIISYITFRWMKNIFLTHEMSSDLNHLHKWTELYTWQRKKNTTQYMLITIFRARIFCYTCSHHLIKKCWPYTVMSSSLSVFFFSHTLYVRSIRSSVGDKKKIISLFYGYTRVLNSIFVEKITRNPFTFLRFLKSTSATRKQMGWFQFCFILSRGKWHKIRNSRHVHVHNIRVCVCNVKKVFTIDRLERKQFPRSNSDKHIRTEFT